MWHNLASWAAASAVVQQVEALVGRLVQVFRGSWLAVLLSAPWQERPPAYQHSRVRSSVGWLLRTALRWRIPTAWLEGSWLLGRWPQWLWQDLVWLWENSLLSGLWIGFGRWVLDDQWNQTEHEQASAPPLWRWLFYSLVLVALAAVSWQWPTMGQRAVKLLLFGVVLLLLWAEPTGTVYVAAFALPFLPVLSSAYLIAWGLLTSWIKGRLRIRSSLLLLMAAMLCIVLLLAAWHSTDVSHSLRYLRYYFAGLALLLLIDSHILTPRQLRQLLAAALVAGALAAFWGVAQYMLRFATDISWVDIRVSAITTRVIGPFDNPNMFAGYLVALLPFPLAAMIHSKTRLPVRLANAALTGLLGLVLLLTFSRGAWLAAVAAGFVLAIYLQPRLFWAIPPLLLLAPWILPEVVWQRLASIVNLEDTSNMVRLHVWNSSLNMWLHNFWLGVGMGIAPFATIYPIFQYGIVPALHAHNLFLQVAVEGGVVALVAFLSFSLGLWQAAVSRWRLAPTLAVATAAALAGQLAYGLFDYNWYDLRLLLLFWLLAGLVIVAYRQRTDEKVRP
ncbi:MAG: O-antigen ligase family protein [Bacillota bacterium]|jgi:putative inorganic carbon (HCO3(-)) transporter